MDLETSGIPIDRKIDKPENQYPDYTDSTKYINSRIVSIGWLYMKDYNYDYEIKLENIYERIIKPFGFIIPEESIKIHGITNEIAQNEGKKIYKVLKKLGNKILKCEYIIGYNIYFDIYILLHELHLKDMKNIIEKIIKMKKEEKIICMGIISANEAKPTGWKKFREYQIPKQTEVYKKCLNKNLQNAHNVKGDILGMIEIIKNLYEKNFNNSENNISLEKVNEHIEKEIKKKEIEDSTSWRYSVTVWEGKPGFADNDWYESKWFNTFEKCYVEYIKFDPSKHFPYL